MSAPNTFVVMQSPFKSFVNGLIRKKKVDLSQTNTKLDRCLTTFDLTALGIGSTLGLGIYVLAGQVASIKAGPSIVISFAVAAIASVFAGLCYAEFGARVPKAGSAYVYSYITVGEFMAFTIGWNLVLEYLIGTASVARGYSAYIDSLVNGTMAAHFKQWMPMDIPHLSPYPDFLSFGITILLSIMLSIGVKESTRFNSIFTGLNICVVVYIIVVGSFKVDMHNWQIPASTTDPAIGDGGFFPFGFSGMMAGAATCFYGFVGFDVIATTGEEAKNPQKAIPIAISASLFLIFLAYFGVSAVQTLMWPYYLQNQDAPLPYVFEKVGYPVAKWVISVGALCGLSTSLLGAMFPLPRILYAMAEDGLIFRSLGAIHPKFKTPVFATILSGVFAAALSAIFDITQLADMMSIGTLLAYSLVAISVLILRSKQFSFSSKDEPVSGDQVTYNGYSAGEIPNIIQSPIKYLFNWEKMKEPNAMTTSISMTLIWTACGLIVLMDGMLVYLEDELAAKNVYVIVPIALVFVMVGIVTFALSQQPQSNSELSFQVPFVPFIPLLSVTINVYLMMKLSWPTWIRFAIWMAIGFSIYFSYGFWNSNIRGSESTQMLGMMDESTGDWEEGGQRKKKFGSKDVESSGFRIKSTHDQKYSIDEEEMKHINSL